MCRAELTCSGLLKYSPHSLSNCSRSCLRSSPSFCLCLPTACFAISLILFLLVFFFVLFPVCRHYLVQALLLPPLPLFAHLRLSSVSMFPSSSASFLHFHLHYHSPHPSPQRTSFVTCKIGVEDNWDSIMALMNRLCGCHWHHCTS